MSVKIAVAYAPIPKNIAWPNETMPPLEAIKSKLIAKIERIAISAIKNLVKYPPKIFDTIAPSIIDVLIPGKREPGQPLSLPEKVINKVCKLCGCGKL